MGGIGDFLFGDEPDSPGEQGAIFYNKALKQFFNPAIAQNDMLFAAAQGTQNDIFDLFGEGFKNARANLSEMGRVGTQGINDSLTQGLAASGQAAINAGLSGGTSHLAQNRMISNDAARRIGELNATLGQLYSGLDVGQAQAQAGALQGKSSLFAQQAGAARDILGMQASGVSGAPFVQGTEGAFGPLVGGLLSGAGMAASGGGTLLGGLGLFAGL